MAKTPTAPVPMSHWNYVHREPTGAIPDSALAGGMTTEQAALSVVMSTKIRSETAFRDKKTAMMDYLFHYLNRPRKRNIPNAHMMNNLSVPMTSEAVDSAHAVIMNKFLKSMKLCHIEPTSMEDKEVCALLERKLMYDNKIMRAYRSYYTATKMGLIFGSAPGYVRYGEKERRHRGLPKDIGNLPKETTYEGSIIEVIDVFDLFPAPEKQVIDDHWPIIRRSFQRWEDLKANESRLEYFDLENIPDKRMSMPSDLQELRQNRRELLRISSAPDIFPDSIEVWEWDGMFPLSGEKDEYGELIYEATIITVANRHLIGMRKNENLSGTNNMIMGMIDWTPGSFWGTGLAEKLHPQQHEGNSIQDLILDNLPMLTNNMWITERGAVVNPAAFITRPNGIIEVTRSSRTGSLRDTVIQLETKPMPEHVFRFYDQIMNRSEMVSGVTEITKGGGKQGVETATEARSQEGWSMNRIQLNHKMFEKTFVEPGHMYMALINQDLVSADFIGKIFPDKQELWSKMQNGLGVTAEPDFIALAGTRETDTSLLIQQVHQLLEIFKGHPILEGAIPYLGAKIAEAYDWIDSEPLIKELKLGYARHLQMLKAKMDADASQLPVNAAGPNSTAPAAGGAGNPSKATMPNPAKQNRTIEAGNNTQMARSASQSFANMVKK